MSKVLYGDALEKLKTLDDNSVQMCITSPPYWGLRDYGTSTWIDGDTECEHTINDGTFDPKKGIVVERPKRGVDRNTCIKCGAKRIDNQIGLENTPEEYIKKMVKVFNEVKRVLKDDGTLWINIGDSYCGNTSRASNNGRAGFGNDREGVFTKSGDNLKPKDLVGIPWRLAFALQSDGWYLRQDIIWHKPNPMPESVKDRCTKAHEYIFLLSKSPQYFYDKDAIAEPATYAGDDRGSRSDSRRGTMCNSVSGKTGETKNKRSVWSIATKPFSGAHFAVFPPEIPELCIKAGSKEGDIVLDPFFGSGTTGLMSMKLGREYVGIELNEKYKPIIDKRLEQETLL